MLFSADDRVLIKVLRQEKGYGAKNYHVIFEQAMDIVRLKNCCGRLTHVAPSKESVAAIS